MPAFVQAGTKYLYGVSVGIRKTGAALAPAPARRVFCGRHKTVLKQPHTLVTMPAINNQEKEQRRQLIADVLLEFITREGKAPSFTELLTLTGLDERRLKQALKTLNFNPETHVLRLLTDSVIMAVYKNATEAGNPASQKLWFQLMENRTDKVLPPDPKKDPEGRVFITMLPPDPMPDYSAKDADFVELSHSDPAALPDGSANPDFPVTRYPAALPRYSAERCLDSDRYSDALPD